MPHNSSGSCNNSVRYARPQVAGDEEKRLFGGSTTRRTMTVVKATSQVEFSKTLGSRTCVFFWAAWHEPSKPGGQMDQVILNDI